MQSTERQAIDLSIIVPVYNEAQTIVACLSYLAELPLQRAEIIVVDGGSDDNTFELATHFDCKVVSSAKGRAHQMNAGASFASGDILVFLHADTKPPANFASLLQVKLEQQASWGFFKVRLSGSDWQFRIIEWFINRRSSLTSIGTGDQVIYLHRSVFTVIGGFAEIPLMEDVELCKRLRAAYGPAKVLPGTAITSSRRWEEKGIARTVLLMWALRWSYWRGESPSVLAERYRSDK